MKMARAFSSPFDLPTGAAFRVAPQAKLGALFLALAASIGLAGAGTLPEGFTEETIPGPWTEAVGLTFEPEQQTAGGRMYAWERGGRVWIVENGVKLSPPLIDISEEVGGWRDFGLLGFALHPNFRQNGYIFLAYTVDHHHLTKFGTPDYHPATNAGIRRVPQRRSSESQSPSRGKHH
jgi:Glucose / Sorbosone dehydrogenase